MTLYIVKDGKIVEVDKPMAVMPSFEECEKWWSKKTELTSREIYSYFASHIRPVSFPSDEEIKNKMQAMDDEGVIWSSRHHGFRLAIAWLKSRMEGK